MSDKKDELEEPPVIKGNGQDDDEDIHIEVLDPDDISSGLLEDASAQAEAAERIIELEKQIKQLQKEKEENYDRLLRKQADFDNFRKRSEKEKREFRQYVIAEFMSELLVIVDNFERALSHAGEAAKTEYHKGVELIYRQMKDLLEKKGLRAMETIGQPFDPNLHEAIAREERLNLPENTILDELQKGYFFQDRLIRPAMVKVSYQPHNDPVEEPSGEETGNEEIKSE